MNPSATLLSKLRTFEGCRLTAYLCPAGVWTIGYGHTKGVTKGMVINLTAAEAFLVQDIKACIKQIENLNLDLTQGEMDALADFVFNLGFTNLKTSTLLKRIKAGVESKTLKANYDAIPAAYFTTNHKKRNTERYAMYKDIIQYEFSRWNKATVGGKKKELAGLTTRRTWEGKRFFE